MEPDRRRKLRVPIAPHEIRAGSDPKQPVALAVWNPQSGRFAYSSLERGDGKSLPPSRRSKLRLRARYAGHGYAITRQVLGKVVRTIA